MNPKTAAAAAESLESRRLFAATLTDGVLAVEGTAGNDTITLTPRNLASDSMLACMLS